MLSVFEFLQHTTVKINCTLRNGDSFSGTGFFYVFQLKNGMSATVIITNRHVVEDAIIGSLQITTINELGKPDYTNQVTVTINDFEDQCIMHPEDDIDLCFFSMNLILSQMNGKEPCYAPFRINQMPDYSNIDDYKPTEEVYMVGYPNGLGDEKNNLPLVRKGITATPFFINHNGDPEFLIDCACFPGSSGSPVLIANESSYSLHKKPLQAGNRLILLGVLVGGPQYNVIGEIEKFKRHTKSVNTEIPMNLGYCIQSKKILDFITMLEASIK